MTSYINFIKDTANTLQLNIFGYAIFIIMSFVFIAYIYWLIYKFTLGKLLSKIMWKIKRSIEKIYSRYFGAYVCINFEKKVEKTLKKMKEVVAVYRDVYIYSESSKKICQIDVLAVTKHALYVIECKNYSGIIVPSNLPNWKYNHSGVKKYYNDHIVVWGYSFYSPVKQNANHIRHLQRIEPELTKDLPIVNLVVFSNNVLYQLDKSKLKLRAAFCKFRELTKFVQFYESELKDNHIDYNKVSTVISNKYANVSKKIKDKHADYIASFEDKEAPTTLLHMYNDSCGEKNRFADFKSNYDLFKRPPFDMDSMYLGHIYPFYRVFQL